MLCWWLIALKQVIRRFCWRLVKLILQVFYWDPTWWWLFFEWLTNFLPFIRIKVIFRGYYVCHYVILFRRRLLAIFVLFVLSGVLQPSRWQLCCMETEWILAAIALVTYLKLYLVSLIRGCIFHLFELSSCSWWCSSKRVALYDLFEKTYFILLLSLLLNLLLLITIIDKSAEARPIW